MYARPKRVHALLLAGALATLSGCAALQVMDEDSPGPAPLPPSYEGGFEGHHVQQALPLGPLPADETVYRTIKQIEAGATWRSADTPVELERLMQDGSQSMAATFAQVFRAGVYHGSPRLMDLACRQMALVTHPGLRRQNRLDRFDSACRSLHQRPPGRDACARSMAGLLEGYDELREGREGPARATTAKALRLRATCPDARPLRRTPVEPSEPGFLVVCVLQAAGAPPITYLAGEPAPRVAEAVDGAYARNVQMLGSTALR